MSQINWFGDKVEKDIVALADKRLERSAIEVTNAAKDLMKNNQTTNRQGQRTAISAPGSAPSVQKSRLVGSVTHEKVKILHWRAGTNVKHGLYTEVGTKNMAARPWLRPALQRTGRFIQNLFRR